MLARSAVEAALLGAAWAAALAVRPWRLLLSVGEASWTCALATLLVACRAQWLATWSDALYLPHPATSRAGR